MWQVILRILWQILALVGITFGAWKLERQGALDQIARGVGNVAEGTGQAAQGIGAGAQGAGQGIKSLTDNAPLLVLGFAALAIVLVARGR